MADRELVSALPENVTMNLIGPTDTVFRINDDPHWQRLRPLINELCRKYGSFAIEVTKLGKVGIY